MEYEKVFAGIAVFAVMIFATFTLLNYYNTTYSQTVGSTMNTTLNSVEIATNLTGISSSGASATQDIEGSGTTNSNDNLVTRSLRIVTILPRLLGLIPDVLYNGAIMIGISSTYVNMAIAVFTFGFVILFAYLLLLGVRRLT